LIPKKPVTLSDPQQRKIKSLLWIFALSFILHNLEELFTMVGFLNRHLPDFPAIFQPIAASIQPVQYTLAIWMLNVLTLPLAWLGASRLQFKRTHQCISLFAVFMGINALTHLGQCLLFDSLAPGAVTAALLILPISILLLRAEFQTSLLKKKQLILYPILTVLAMPLIIWTILGFSGWIISLGSPLK
jgi:hypothetical protein